MIKSIEVEALALLLYESGSNIWLDIRGLLDLQGDERFIYSDLCQKGESKYLKESL